MPLAFITGGSRGLGFETARQLRDRGFDLVLFAKDADRLSHASKQLGAKYELFDAENAASTQNAFSAALKNHGTPDVLVLAHGVMSARDAKTIKTTESEWRRVLSINLDSVFYIVSLIGKEMVEQRSGRIIIYSACLGRMSGPGNAGGLAPYRISKAGVNALTRNFAHESNHGQRGVLIDAVCPNHTQTDMGGPNAPRTVAEGAACAVWLATRAFDPTQDKTGLLWEDNEVIPW